MKLKLIKKLEQGVRPRINLSLNEGCQVTYKTEVKTKIAAKTEAEL